MDNMQLEAGFSLGSMRQIREAIEKGDTDTAIRLTEGYMTIDQIKALLGDENGELAKNFNDNHDPRSGRFSSGTGSSQSSTGGVDEIGLVKVRKPKASDPKIGTDEQSYAVKGDKLIAGAKGQTVEFTLNAREQRLFNEQKVKAWFIDPATDSSIKKVYGEYIPPIKRIRLNADLVDHMSSTFYHEVGHALDHAEEGVDRGMKTFPRQMFKIRSKTSPIGKEKVAIVRQRLNEAMQVNYGLSKKDVESIDDYHRQLLMKGSFIVVKSETGKTHTPMFLKRQLTYMQQPDEVFAEAYSQYRTNPTVFKEYAPETYKVLEGITQ